VSAPFAGEGHLLHGVARLAALSVAGNQLTTLIDLVTQLPKLAMLDFSGNPRSND
jgi:Leucine-rich repeat (LRR) protein